MGLNCFGRVGLVAAVCRVFNGVSLGFVGRRFVGLFFCSVCLGCVCDLWVSGFL